MNFLEKSKQNMIEIMVAAGIPINEKVAIEDAEKIENKDEPHETDNSAANVESIENFDPSKRYTKAQKLQFAIDFCKKQNPQGHIFSETQDIPVSKEDIENFFIFDSDATDENIYFLYKKTNGGTLCGRAKYAYSYQPAVNSKFYQSLHASSKKLNGKESEHLASGAEATSIQERIIGTYIAAFIAGTLTENSKFYTLGEVLCPNEQCCDKNINNGKPLFNEAQINSKGIDVSWSKMFDKLFYALKADAKDKSHQAEFNFESLDKGKYACIHPNMPDLTKGLEKLFASGVSGSQTSKDTVIPADLYLINTDYESNIINAFNTAKSLDDMCALTNYFFGTVPLDTLMTSTDIEASPDLALIKNMNSSRESAELNLNNAIIIPISLKKNESAPNVYLIMNTPQNIPKVRVQDITQVVFNKCGNSYFKAVVDVDDKTNSEFRKHFGDKEAYFEFRWKNAGANWQCTATVEDADAYLGGSVKEVANQVLKENKMTFFGENKVGFEKEDIELLYDTFKEKIKIKYDKKESPKAAAYQDMIDLHESMLGGIEEESSSKAGRCGLFQVLISLLRQSKSNQDTNLSEIVAKSFKMDPSIQDTVKIM